MMRTASLGRTLAWIALFLSVAAALSVLAAGPGSRLGLWGFRRGFWLMRMGAYGALAGAALGLSALLARGPRLASALALLVGLSAFGGPWLWRRGARAVPPIHDISTDTEDPPRFTAVLARRAGAPNTTDYGGAAVAAQQRAAYPDVQPLTLSAPPARAFEAALQAARRLGWEIVASLPQEGRIEATDTTPWFGFKDDVVVRIRPHAQGCRVDVRSLSRVGMSDLGANARRIRRFLERLRQEAAGG